MSYNLPLQVLMAAICTLSFSLILNVPRKEVLFCGLTGSVCWLCYQLVLLFFGDGSLLMANFLATLLVTVSSRILSYRRRMPMTIYLITGIIPLVPGAGIYNTMYHMVSDENMLAFAKGIETLKIAGVIAIGILMVLSLPSRLFRWPFISSSR